MFGTSLAIAQLTFAGVAWTRPLGLLALALPLLLVLWARRRQPARDEATGALAIWRALSVERSASFDERRRGLPRDQIWLLAALVLTALALAGPRQLEAGGVEAWTILVDRSPSMYLPLEPGGSEPRLEAAVREAREWLDDLGVNPEARSWDDGGGEVWRGAAAPRAWSVAPTGHRPAPSWGPRDAAGVLLVSDAAPQEAPLEASWLAIGGEAIPGAVAAGLYWNGADIEELGASEAGEVVVTDLPRELVELVDIWREDRGLLRGESDQAALLVVRGVTDGTPESRGAGRDGWEIEGTWVPGAARDADSQGPLAEWLAPGLVSFGPGRVHVALREVASFAGDPASFAVSWSRLLDRACLPPAGVVPLAQRRAVGPSGRGLGVRPPVVGRSRDEAPFEAWLLIGALLLAIRWGLSQRAPG